MSHRSGRDWVAEAGRFIRANLSSTMASGVEYALVTALILFHVHYLAATAIGAVTGALTDFSLKRYWAFDRAVKGAVHHEGMKYLVVSVGSLLLNLALSYMLVDGLHMPPVPGVILASLIIGFVWNYPLHRCFVFRCPPPSLPNATPGEP